MSQLENSQELNAETSAEGTFVPPSVDPALIAEGTSYTYHSPLPEVVVQDAQTPCVLGVDEAGRGPVLGAMVYGVLYLPISQHQSLLAETHHFDDSKVLTAQVRSDLLQKLCTPGSDLFRSCGWTTRVMSARDISAGMLQPGGNANLNQQAMAATVALIQEVYEKGVNVTEIYVDTIGAPHIYQARLERVFPQARITVAKKADSLYPCVSAASVCAKVTRDVALDAAHEIYLATRGARGTQQLPTESAATWGSGYPGDARTAGWLKSNMDPFFGWGDECRFSWATAKDMLEAGGVQVEWPEPEDQDTARVTDFFSAGGGGEKTDELAAWYGEPSTGLC